MVEFAVLLPLMMVLFLGSWTAADLIADNDTALQATRAGARYAAELGAAPPASVTASACQSSLTSDPNTCQVDLDIINQMLPVVNATMPNAVVTEIDIYEPSGGSTSGGTGCTTFSSTCPPNRGAYTASAGEPINEYAISGTSVTAPTKYPITCTPTPIDCYTLSQRWQVHPDEAELGVRIVFKYTSPTLKFFTQQDTQYTVVRLSPEE
jgi:Flp pilus assembly protein TadG